MMPGAWESGRGNHLCPESVENLPGNRAGDFRIPESLTKENYILKKKSYLRDWPYAGVGMEGLARMWEPYEKPQGQQW